MLAALFIVLMPAAPLVAGASRDATDDAAPRAQDAAQPVRDRSTLDAAIAGPNPSPNLDERAARLALDKGLDYLARRHAETANGSFPTSDARERAPVGVTALSTLAFMAAGNSPDRGPYGAQVSRAIDYLLDHTDLAPESLELGYISTQDDLSRTHGHGYATLVLAEAHGMAPGRRGQRIARALEAAVRRIEISQSEQGGWEYEPIAVPTPEGSVTICLVQALRAARNSGIRVDSGVIRRAEDYVERLQKDDGTFRYKLDMESSTVALTAAAVTTLNMAGRYDDTVIRSAVDAIWSGLLLQQEDPKRLKFPFYQRLYIAQAFWQMADTDHFARWFEDERVRLLRTQRPDGSWADRTYGDCYATAMNCLVLAIPEGLLPIFQR